jgi:hypothetical protein
MGIRLRLCQLLATVFPKKSENHTRCANFASGSCDFEKLRCAKTPNAHKPINSQIVYCPAAHLWIEFTNHFVPSKDKEPPTCPRK